MAHNGDFKAEAEETFRNGNSSTSTTDRLLRDLLREIQDMNDTIRTDGTFRSQASARMNRQTDTSQVFRNMRASRHSYSTRDFSDALEEALLESVLGSDFKNKMNNVFEHLAHELDVSMEDLPGKLGKSIGDILVNTVKETKIGSKVYDAIDDIRHQAADRIKTAYTSGRDSYIHDHPEQFKGSATMGGAAVRSGTTSGIKSAVSGLAKAGNANATLSGLAKAGNANATLAGLAKAADANATLAGLAKAAGSVIAPLAATTVGLALLDAATGELGKSFKHVGDSAKGLMSGLGSAWNRANKSREQRVENANKRLQADIESMIRAPFQILEDAASKVYQTWDANLRMINGTQGYSKADLQSLMGVYANRLREENLSSVISTTDITNQLSNVLKSGLSGKVAEEFAYQATKLNAAIPTQDFFGYASTYASLVANAVKDGESQSKAIEYANKQLQLFASNILYANRQLTGGVTTGLQDAGGLFSSAVQIAQASKTGNPAQIAGVLTSVSAITGAIAPDLASSLTDAIVQAATGGNSSQLVALRSLAGINASNTEFLQQLATDPKGVFSTLFTNLGRMQHMADGAYMEVAEGLSSIFGIPKDAFARVDFGYLAKAIDRMDVSTKSLNENISHLASGQTTTSAEQLRMQQINKFMIDEGLSYVLDNEVARTIQQHMWDEQIANQLMEAQYSVDLTGKALGFLESIQSLIHTVLNVLTLGIAGNDKALVVTVGETKKLTQDIGGLLEAGKVGTGRNIDFYNLTTRGKDLGLVDSIVNLMGGQSKYKGQKMSSALASTAFNLTNSDIASAYLWSGLSKSGYSDIYGTGVATGNLAYQARTKDAMDEVIKNNTVHQLQRGMNRLLDKKYVNEFVDSGKSYDEWIATAGNFGIADLDNALDKLDMSESQLQDYYTRAQGSAAARVESEHRQRETTYWNNTEQYQLEMRDNTLAMIDLMEVTNTTLDNILAQCKSFYTDWVDYYINQVYFRKNFTAQDESRIKAAEKEEATKAIYTLANVLTGTGKDLLDPTIQTNALLSQILIIVQAIMQQGNTPGQISIPDSLSAMATGMFKK